MQRIALASLLLLVALISLVKGGVFEWASLIWGAIIYALIANHIAFKKYSANDVRSFFSYKAIIAFLAFQVWSMIQLFLPSTNDVKASIDTSLLGFSLLGFLFILSNALKAPKAYLHLFNGLVLLGLIQALYGLYILLSGDNKLLWMDKVFYLDRPTGFFVNPNHFAAYISLPIILLVSKLFYDEKANPKNNTIWLLFDRLFEPKFIVTLVLLMTLLMTKSIGAIGAMFMVIVSVISINIIKNKFSKITFIYAGISITAVLLLLLTIDSAIILKESAGLSHTFERRIALSLASWDMLKDHWLFGVGGGSFYSAFSQYRNLEIGNTYYNFAHNDYLQFWIEYGLIGVTTLILFISLALRKNYAILQRTNNTYRKAFAITSLIGTAILAIHSTVDFPLHIPAYCVLYLCILSANLFPCDTDTPQQD